VTRLVAISRLVAIYKELNFNRGFARLEKRVKSRIEHANELDDVLFKAEGHEEDKMDLTREIPLSKV
jgi:hypothetical protein